MSGVVEAEVAQLANVAGMDVDASFKQFTMQTIRENMSETEAKACGDRGGLIKVESKL